MTDAVSLALDDMSAHGHMIHNEFIQRYKEHMAIITGKGIEKPILRFGATEDEATKEAVYLYRLKFPAK